MYSAVNGKNDIKFLAMINAENLSNLGSNGVRLLLWYVNDEKEQSRECNANSVELCFADVVVSILIEDHKKVLS